MSGEPAVRRIGGLPLGAVAVGLIAVGQLLLDPSWRPITTGLVITIGAASIVRGVRHNRPPAESGWRRATIGIAAFSLCDASYLSVVTLGGQDHPLALIPWVLGYGGVMVAVSGFRRVLRTGQQQVDLEARLDSAIVVIALAYLGWYGLGRPQVEAHGWVNYASTGALAFGLAVLWVVGLLVARGLRNGGSVAYWALMVAAPLTAANSLVFWLAEQHHHLWESAPLARLLAGLAYAAAAIAVWHPSMRSLAGSKAPETRSVARLLVVGAGVSVVPTWMLVDALGLGIPMPSADPIGATLGLGVTVAAVVRVGVTLRSRYRVEHELSQREARFRSMVEHAYDYVLVVDEDWVVRWGTANTGAITGRGATELAGKVITDEVVDDDLPTFVASMQACLTQPDHRANGQVRVAGEDHRVRWIEYTLVNQLGNPAVQGIVVNYRDATGRMEDQRELERQALHDPLTGLPNRTNLMEALRRWLEDGEDLSLLFLDLDRFKIVNDSLGHHVGDRLLETVAERLRRVVHPRDLVARIGGDEFVVVARGTGRVAAASLAARLCDALGDPLVVDGLELSARTSIGVAVASPSSTPDELLRDADTAMYRVKHGGRDGFALFDDRWRAATSARLRLEGEIRRALSGDGFDLHYQPIVQAGSATVVAVEALLRWRGAPPEGMDGPATTEELIVVAEETGLINAVGEWAVQRACQDLAELRARHPEHDLHVSVNVSGAQLRREGFASAVLAALKTADLPAECLTLELTESVLVEDAPVATGCLHGLRHAGVKLAMDDFGTGYSALANLTRIPLSVVKVDRSFVDGLIVDGHQAAIVRAVVGMAHALGMHIVAEGVEHRAQASLLHQLGCDFLQGYLYGRGMPMEDLSAWLEVSPGRAAAVAALRPA